MVDVAMLTKQGGRDHNEDYIRKIKKENIRCGQSFRNVKYIIYDHVCDHYVISGVKYAGNLTE